MGAKVVAVSGGYDPLHIGHLRNILEAQKLGDSLIVILARDNQLIDKKGFVFMPYEERKEILEGIKGVSEVVENIDEYGTCKKSLFKYHPDVFAKGGDTWDEENLPEAEVCRELNIHVVFGVGGVEKVQSSSDLVNQKRGEEIVRALIRRATELSLELDLGELKERKYTTDKDKIKALEQDIYDMEVN